MKPKLPRPPKDSRLRRRKTDRWSPVYESEIKKRGADGIYRLLIRLPFLPQPQTAKLLNLAKYTHLSDAEFLHGIIGVIHQSIPKIKNEQDQNTAIQFLLELTQELAAQPKDKDFYLKRTRK